MALSEQQRAVAVWAFGTVSDETIALPLWEFHPDYRPLILSERTRRSLLQGDPEPIGDPEYT